MSQIGAVTLRHVGEAGGDRLGKPTGNPAAPSRWTGSRIGG
jgi:hypothetical protein